MGVVYLSQWLQTLGSSRFSDDVTPIRQHDRPSRTEAQGHTRKSIIVRKYLQAIKKKHIKHIRQMKSTFQTATFYSKKNTNLVHLPHAANNRPWSV